MKCPVDNETLVMTDRNGVEIDYCPRCRGVWLDRGELDKIIERSAAPPAPPAAAAQTSPGWSGPPHQSGYHPPYQKRRKSFLEELFD